ncbi:MAG: hypothetical protein U0263_06580 [Polyangiaceae bacterium]
MRSKGRRLFFERVGPALAAWSLAYGCGLDMAPVGDGTGGGSVIAGAGGDTACIFACQTNYNGCVGDCVKKCTSCAGDAGCASQATCT